MTYNPRHWEIQYQLDRHRGIRRYQSTAKVKERIEWLMGQGFSAAAIAAAADVDRGTVLDALSGKNRMITLKKEKKIMAVTPEDIYAQPGRGYVPAIGAVRRIQALITMGWRYKDLNELCGIRTEKVGEGAGWIGRANHEKIRKLYDELWDKRGPAAQANITRALNKGWAKPMAWDDDTIDDPAAKPFGTVTERRAA